MKNYYFISIIVFLLSVTYLISCEKDCEEEYISNELCTYRDTISAPPGYSISFIDTLGKSVYIDFLQFIDDQTGYALGSGKYNYADVLKTTDGGYHWSDLHFDFNYSPEGMIFTSEDTGIVTIFDGTGCPSNCQLKCVVIRTTDGGVHWDKLEIQNLRGQIGHMAVDAKGNIFGVLSYEHSETLVWSDDTGIDWDTFPVTELIPEHIGDLQVFGDNMYLVSQGLIRIINLQSGLIKTINIPKDFLNELKILSTNQFILSNYDSLFVTDDVFQTTRTLYVGYSKLIGYNNTDNVIVILNKSYCPTDVVQSNDLMAFTENGGQTWTEGQLCTNLIYSIDVCHQVEEGRYILLAGRNIYELKKE